MLWSKEQTNAETLSGMFELLIEVAPGRTSSVKTAVL